jgi:hypothetical protein
MLDSDIQNGDAALHVEFYKFQYDPYKGQDFVRIMVPGDATNIIETPVKEHHKQRFTRQWLYYQMQQNGPVSTDAIGGTSLADWHAKDPAGLHEVQLGELQILKFSTVEQVATATDAQLQKIGMGASGLRERARAFLKRHNRQVEQESTAETKSEVEELKALVAQLMAERQATPPPTEASSESNFRRPPGRPRKEPLDVVHDVATGDASHQ